MKPNKFIQNIIEKLNEVNPNDWENYTNFKVQFPKNAITKRNYKGTNIFSLLLCDIFPKGRISFEYATFNQISHRKGKLKKGSKGIPIEFFSVSVKHKQTETKINYNEYLLLSAETQKFYDVYKAMKHYTVFNIADIENLEEMDFAPIAGEEESTEFEEVLNGETLIKSLITDKNLILQHSKTSVAKYSPLEDKIIAPYKKYFVDAPKYYSTIFHEIIHWTGHESRLNRDFKNKFGSDGYAFEELVAEMGSMLINFDMGILDEFTNSVRYLKGWLLKTPQEEQEKKLQDALYLSRKAVKFITQN